MLRNFLGKQMGIPYVAKETPDCGLKIASNEGSLIMQKNITIQFDVTKEMESQLLLANEK